MSVELAKIEIQSIFRRRKTIFFTTFILIFLICTIVAFVLPSYYRSQIMIVVENQEIPEEYVKSTITTFVSERLEILSKKILSYSKLLEIIEENELYPHLSTTGEKVSQMRRAIELKTIDVALRDRHRGVGAATIAFTLSYEYIDAEKAKKVADILGNLYVEEDQKVRKKQAGTTTLFLERELEELRRQVELHEEKISRFKAANINQLPGSTATFSQTIFRLEQKRDEIDTRIRTIQEKIVYLQSQINNIDPMVPILTEDGKVASNPGNRLKYLRMQLIRMQANLSEKHPDVIRMKSEIEELEQQVGNQNSTSEQRNRLAVVKKQIAEVRSKYGEKHPDVIRLTKEANLLERQISTAQYSGSVDEEQSDNPAYMNLKAQIIVAVSEIDALREERVKVSKKLEDYQRRLEIAPFVDEEYNALTLDYANAKQKYNEVSHKLHAARIAKEMDTTERGERFRIEYPANLPSAPSKPNRLLIILMGFVLGIGGGIILAALFEGLDSSVKSTAELEGLTGVPVLATVSFFDSPQQKWLKRKKQIMIGATVLAIVLITSLMINWFYMPMDELWVRFEERLIEIGVPIEKES